MAIDLVALLGGNNNLENQYQAQDPWYQAARGISQVQTAAPRDDTEAFLLPFLQNTLAGGLAGYGRQSAQQTAYKDFSNLLSGMNYQPSALAGQLAGEDPAAIQYGLDEMPENFSIKAAAPDLLLAVGQQQAQQEAAIKNLELQQKLAIESSQPYLEQIKKAEQAKAAGKTAGELGDIRKEIVTKATEEQSLDFIDQKYTEAKQLVGAKAALGGITANLGIPTAESQALEGLGDSVVVQIDKAIGRELNSDVRKRLLSLAPKWFDSEKDIETKRVAMKDLVKSLSAPTPGLESAGLVQSNQSPPIPAGAVNTGRTSGGKPVYSVNGRLWTP